VVTGPISLVVSTTSIDVDPELENRAIVLEVSESRELTRAIHEQQRERETLAGILAREEREGIVHLHRNAQRLLRPLKVVNPYAAQLGFPDTTTRARRDHRKYLSLIRAVTFLHQFQREVKTATHGGRAIEYVEVARDDIAVTNQLAHAVLGRSLGSVPPQTRGLLGLVVDMVGCIADAQNIPGADVRFTRRMLREHTGWGETQLKVHLRRLVELEYVLPHRRGAGGLHRYELLFAGDPEDEAPCLAGLRDVEDLREPETFDYGNRRSGRKPARSGGGRPEAPTGTDGAAS